MFNIGLKTERLRTKNNPLNYLLTGTIQQKNFTSLTVSDIVGMFGRFHALSLNSMDCVILTQYFYISLNCSLLFQHSQHI